MDGGFKISNVKFEFCKHSDLSSDYVKKIIELKSIHWNYTFEQQISWMKNNLMKDDIHVLMLDNEELVGYMNLVNVIVNINCGNRNFLGIGNVCSRNKFSGLGSKLLIGANEYLTQNDKNGILLCKDNLVGFYEKFEWQLIDKKNIISEDFKYINVMIFNLNLNVESLVYEGRNF